MNLATITKLLKDWEQNKGFTHRCTRCRRNTHVDPDKEIFKCSFCYKETHIRQVLNHELMIEQLIEKNPNEPTYRDFEPRTLSIKEIARFFLSLTRAEEITFKCQQCEKTIAIPPTYSTKVCPRCMFRNTAPNAAIQIIKEMR